MTDFSTTENIYKNLSTEKLLSLAKELNSLKPEVIPFLKKELLARGKEYEVKAIEISMQNRVDFDNLTLNEIQELVAERLSKGESIENIKHELKDNGIDTLKLFELFNIYYIHALMKIYIQLG